MTPLFLIAITPQVMAADEIIMVNSTCGTLIRKCDGSCMYDSSMTSGKYQCVSSLTRSFCFDGRWTFFLLWLFFLIPTVLCMIISYKYLTYHPPTSAFVLNLFTNSLSAVLFNGIWCTSASSFNLGGNIVMISISGVFIIMLFIFGYFACPMACKDRNTWVTSISHQMHSRVIPIRYLQSGIKSIRQSFPQLQIHTEVQKETGFGQRKTSMQSFAGILTLPDESVQYATWQEEGQELTLPEDGDFLVDICIDVELSNSLIDRVQRRMDAIAEDEFSSGGIARSSLVKFVSDYLPKFVAEAGGGGNCFQKFMRHWAGVYIFYFFAAIGFNCVLETIWCGVTKRVVVHSVKRVSDKDEYRVKSGEIDGVAATYAPTSEALDSIEDDQKGA